MLCCAVQWLCCAVLCYAVLYYAELRCDMVCCAALRCYVLRCCTVLCCDHVAWCGVLCCAVLCCAVVCCGAALHCDSSSLSCPLPPFLPVSLSNLSSYSALLSFLLFFIPCSDNAIAVKTKARNISSDTLPHVRHKLHVVRCESFLSGPPLLELSVDPWNQVRNINPDITGIYLIFQCLRIDFPLR